MFKRNSYKKGTLFGFFELLSAILMDLFAFKYFSSSLECEY